MATFRLCTHILFLFLLPHFLSASPASEDDLLVTTKHGKVQGKLLSVLGGDVRAFLGIPYGKPPLGKLRFRAPEPVAAWQGVRDATKFLNTCHQIPDTVFPGRIYICTDGHDAYMFCVLCCVFKWVFSVKYLPKIMPKMSAIT